MAKRIFKEPIDMWKAYEAYKKDIIENPIKIEDYVGKDAKLVERKKYKPRTWEGFETYLFHQNINHNAKSGQLNLDKYRYNFEGAYEEFVCIIRAINNDMFDRNFSGAAVGEYQHNIIARKLGLADTQEVKTFEKPILENGKELPEDD